MSEPRVLLSGLGIPESPHMTGHAASRGRVTGAGPYVCPEKQMNETRPTL